MWLRLAPRRRILAKQRSMCSSLTFASFASPITGAIQFRRIAAPEGSGLLAGDRIVSAGGETVIGPQVVARHLLRASAGAAVPLQIDRGGKTVVVPLR